MDIRYLSDAKGIITGVFIPLAEWERLQKQYNIHDDDTPAPANPQLPQRLGEALGKRKNTK